MAASVSRRSFVATAGFALAALATPGTAQAKGLDKIKSAVADISKSATKQSPDKYTWYIKDYTGMNAATIGYTSLGGDRLDKYGDGLLKIIFMTADGSYVDINDEDALKKYSVCNQSLPPDTEIKLTFLKDSNGEEYGLTDVMSQDSIVLAVTESGSNAKPTCPQGPNAAPDKYTRYVRDYTGLNAASIGYTAMSNRRYDKYGQSLLEVIFASDGGEYVDPTDEDNLKSYVVYAHVVYAQDVDPNTPITLTFLTDSSGNEYSNLVDTSSVESITLFVTALNPGEEQAEVAPEVPAEEAPAA